MYIEIFRLFFFCVKAHRITNKTRKKTLSLLLFITLQFTFEKRPVLGLARVAYPFKKKGPGANVWKGPYFRRNKVKLK